MALHTTVVGRYVGAASFISLKTPQEGFMRQNEMLEDIRDGYKEKGEKNFKLSQDQQAAFQAGLQNFNNFGGHGSGWFIWLGVRYSDHLSLTGILFWVPSTGIFGLIYTYKYYR